MKRLIGLAFVFTLLSVPAFAKNSQTVLVPKDVTVGSTHLPAGQYKVTWTGTGSSVQVTLKQEDVHAPATATVQAKLVEQNNGTASVTIDTQGEVNTLELIQLKHVNLVLSTSPAPGQ